MRIWALSLVLGVVALASGCVFTDLADLPPPIAIQNNSSNNSTTDTDVDTSDMAPDISPEDCPKAEFLTTSGVTHLGLDQIGDVVLYAARLSSGGIQLGRLEGNTHTVIPVVNLPANNIHALEVTALGPGHMIIAVIEGANRTLRLYNCAGNSCEVIALGEAFTDSEVILDVTLDKNPPSVGVRREVSGLERYSALLLDVVADDPFVGGLILRLGSQTDDVAGVQHLGLGQAQYRVVGGQAGFGYFVGEGESPITPMKCGTFDRSGSVPYFTRIKPGGSKFLLRTRELLLTDCINTTTLSTQFIADADYLHIANDDYFAAWNSMAGIEGAFAGDEVTTLMFSNSPVQHVQVARMDDEFLVFAGGTNTNLSLLRGTKDDLVACFTK